MFAVYATKGNPQNPLESLAIGERPEPVLKDGWVRVKVSHASLNRHDIFTLQGLTAQETPIPFPMIMGNDGCGTLDDGTEVIIFPVMGDPDWKGDEMEDPKWHVFSELVPGTFADYVAVPKRNAIPRPKEISALDASVLGTAWLTAYRILFTKSNLRSGQTMLVQGASGGMATALIQMGRAAGFEVWVTSRSHDGAKLAEKLGAHRIFKSGEKLPRKVDAVFDNVGPATFEHSLGSTRRGGTLVTVGVTTGLEAKVNLLDLFVNNIIVTGSTMGTLDEMKNLIQFVISSGIKPEIGQIVSMDQAKESFKAMWEGRIRGKTVFTR